MPNSPVLSFETCDYLESVLAAIDSPDFNLATLQMPLHLKTYLVNFQNAAEEILSNQ